MTRNFSCSAASINALIDVVGRDHVLVNDDVTSSYRTDWTGRYCVGSTPVVRPSTTQHVQQIVRIAANSGFAIVPQGGNTGLVGGGIPSVDGAVILSTSRLRTIGEIDMLSGQVLVDAGVRLGTLQLALKPTGFSFGVDLAARDSCTIGGMTATNAGGINVVRYGTMRKQVLGIEAVLGDATIVSHLKGLEKDNTGFDLEGLLTGSEGTLGVVTKVLLRLVKACERYVTIAVGFAAVGDAVAAASMFRHDVSNLYALELLLKPGIECVRQAFGGDVPEAMRAAAVLLVETAGTADQGESDLERVCYQLADVIVSEPAVAVSDKSRRSLWRWREELTAAIATLGIPLKLDVSLPLRKIEAFLTDLNSIDTPTPPIVFGHLGDGNLHINVPACFSPADELKSVSEFRASQIEHKILALVVSHGGSISAEHGIGVAKTKYLSMTRSAGDITAFRSIKRAFDPHSIFNPGVLLAREGA